ncbi:DUF3152 domain-containing protein [Micromonospora sp. NPDC005324]|uniref:DUF3152 domain-containing protein n=1 Tax=Micromonospora sp. NPDC005324 TaxID=3157033 RepID=UPI0033A0384A
MVGGVLALIGVFVAPPEAPATSRPVQAVRSPKVMESTRSTPPVRAEAPESAAPRLRVLGTVPSTGRGTFEYAAGRGSTVGRAGRLLRYRVAVEYGANENVGEFADAVEATLSDRRSWIGGGDLRLQRVPRGDSYDFTVFLVTSGTAREMCAAVWVDIRVYGEPFTSCRGQGKVIINLDRWKLSVDHFVEAKVSLDIYRKYVINHEVGHELGNAHQRCPGAGMPAPVMMQQTLFLKGCMANPWPYLGGELHSGPQL